MQPEAALPEGFTGRFLGAWPFTEPVNGVMIRLWCELLEDANPLYHDAEYARSRGFADIIAPPAMFLPWAFEPTWSPATGPIPVHNRALHDVPGYPNATVLRVIQTHHRPLQLGERPFIHYFVGEPSPETETPRGRGRVLHAYTSFRDGEGNEIAAQEQITLRFRPGGLKPEPASEAVTGDWDETSAPPLERRTEAMPPLHWADVHEGETIPALYFPLTLKRFIISAAATRDFYEVHHDRDYARGIGVRDMYLGIHVHQGLIGRYLSDWSGPSGMLKRLEVRLRDRNYPGDTLRLSGRVLRKDRLPEGGRVEVEVVVANPRGVTHEATATLALSDA
jgi:acyl dehydratase